MPKIHGTPLVKQRETSPEGATRFRRVAQLFEGSDNRVLDGFFRHLERREVEHVDMGNQVQEVLNRGQDELLTKLFIEYIEDQENLEPSDVRNAEMIIGSLSVYAEDSSSSDSDDGSDIDLDEKEANSIKNNVGQVKEWGKAQGEVFDEFSNILLTPYSRYEQKVRGGYEYYFGLKMTDPRGIEEESVNRDTPLKSLMRMMPKLNRAEIKLQTALKFVHRKLSRNARDNMAKRLIACWKEVDQIVKYICSTHHNLKEAGFQSLPKRGGKYHIPALSSILKLQRSLEAVLKGYGFSLNQTAVKPVEQENNSVEVINKNSGTTRGDRDNVFAPIEYDETRIKAVMSTLGVKHRKMLEHILTGSRRDVRNVYNGTAIEGLLKMLGLKAKGITGSRWKVMKGNESFMTYEVQHGNDNAGLVNDLGIGMIRKSIVKALGLRKEATS